MKMLEYRRNAGLALIAFFVLANTLSGQTSDAIQIQTSKAADCEFNNLLLDTVIISSKKKGERLFIIARPGRNEGNRINVSRLGFTRSVISDAKKGMPKSEITIATGEPSGETNGKLEFWIGSKLHVVISTLRNKPVCYLTPDYCGRKNELCK